MKSKGVTLVVCVALVCVALIATGCAGRQSIEELRHEALITGDWTEVEQREAYKARRDAARNLSKACSDAGGTLFCTQSGSQKECACLGDREFRMAIGQ